MKKMQDETLQKLMFSKWSYFTKSNYGYLQNTFIKEIDKIGHTVGHIANSIAFSLALSNHNLSSKAEIIFSDSSFGL